jgi:hypothetical protein
MISGCKTGSPYEVSSCQDNKCTTGCVKSPLGPMQQCAYQVAYSVLPCDAVVETMYDNVGCTGKIITSTWSPANICNGGQNYVCR